MGSDDVTRAIGRRELGRLTMGALGAAALGASLRGEVRKVAPGIKLCVQSPPNPSDEQLLFLKQLGAGYVSVGVDAGPAHRRRLHADQEALRRRRHHGVEHRQHRASTTCRRSRSTCPAATQKIEEYKQYLRNLGKAGIGYTTYAHMGNGIWTQRPHRGPRRVGARVRPEQPERARQLGRQGLHRPALARPRVHARKRSGRTTPTSSSRSCRSRRRPACASAFIPTIRRCRCWPACRAASSATSTATSGRWRSPTARTSASASAAAPGSKAARS